MKKHNKHLKRVNQIIESLRAYNPEKIYLFGSWARGEGDDLSDVDLVVIKKTKTPFLLRLREAVKFLPVKIGVIDILVYTPEEFDRMSKQGNAFAEMILEEGQLIYDGQTKNRSTTMVSPGLL